MFANRYIENNIIYPEFIDHSPSENLGMIVVIPCYREPEIWKTLDSLNNCIMPSCDVEVIIVVNQPEGESRLVSETNMKTFDKLQIWKTKNNKPGLCFSPIFPDPFPQKYAGAGMARKTGMDEAVRRFHRVNNPEGIIVSLDADTTVARNYMQEIEKFFSNNTEDVAATICFKHRIDTETMGERQIEGIRLYERYLHYYKKALTYTGYPFALYTIGSAFCCIASAYVKQGGMNRKKAGEDFYFLHKLSQLGNIGEINSTCVYPLARLSDRVPFGTGPILKRWLEGKEDLSQTYNFQSFIDVKLFFDKIGLLFKIDEKRFGELIEDLPGPFQQFIKEDRFYNELKIINQNVASADAFHKRFFQAFNSFKILKYINYSHSFFYLKQDISEAEKQLSVHFSTL